MTIPIPQCSLGQLIWALRPESGGLSAVFDPAIVLSDTLSVAEIDGLNYSVPALVFSPTGGGALIPQFITVTMYLDLETASKHRSGPVDQPWAGTVSMT